MKRMTVREFTEIDLRTMVENASGYRRDVEPTRWVIESRLRRQSWEVIVEPDPVTRSLVVVTAYPRKRTR